MFQLLLNVRYVNGVVRSYPVGAAHASYAEARAAYLAAKSDPPLALLEWLEAVEARCDVAELAIGGPDF